MKKQQQCTSMLWENSTPCFLDVLISEPKVIGSRFYGGRGGERSGITPPNINQAHSNKSNFQKIHKNL